MADGKGNVEQWAELLEQVRAGFRTEDELRAENERIFAEVLRLRDTGPDPAEGVFGVLALEQALERVTRERDRLLGSVLVVRQAAKDATVLLPHERPGNELTLDMAFVRNRLYAILQQTREWEDSRRDACATDGKPVPVARKCEMRGCRSGLPATVGVLDSDEADTWIAKICHDCAKIIGVDPGLYLPENAVELVEKAYRERKAGL